ncbi:MAG TPA: polysaccharide deacetylase family protein [Xanthobacteraceae bacterium]|nr:polysaccharide deacetylase family protein [Xanthobacteraceae bacterium]
MRRPVLLLLLAAASCGFTDGVRAETAASPACVGRPGTARTLAVAPAGLRVGTKHFADTLPLADHELVLTFDDGPLPATTPLVLKALAEACVHATFFVVGRNAADHPALVRRILAEGHTLAHHSMTHPMTLADLPFEAAVAEIEKGFAADDTAAYGSAAGAPRVPFFRFPGFGSSPRLLDYLAHRGVAVFDADLWGSDWEPMTPEVQFKLMLERIEKARRGIVLLHDIKMQTARMLPELLRALDERGYRIVHLVPPADVALSPAR